MRDLRGTQEAREWNEELNRTPEDEEIDGGMRAVKDSAPGIEGVRMGYINLSTQEMKTEVRKMVKRAHKWEQELKVGQIVSLFKKGDKNTKNNYRGVCLLAMGSRILGRVLASRLYRWSEALALRDGNQCGFCPGRSTSDAKQIMIRMEEDVQDLR